MPRGFQTERSVVEAFADLRADYDAAKPSVLRRTRTGLGGSGDAHYAQERAYFGVMEYVRDMDRNDALIGWMLDHATHNTVQNGFGLDPQTGDKALDDELVARWDEWTGRSSGSGRACDATGERTFWELEEMTFRAALTDGDAFTSLVDDGTLEPFEAHRCRTPASTDRNVVHGVWLDGQRRRREYWFTRESNVPLQSRVQTVGEVERLPAYDDAGNPLVLHVANPKRMTQTRGVSALVPVMDTAGMTGDLLFAKLVQAQMVSCFVAAIQYEQGADTADVSLGQRVASTDAAGNSSISERITPGTFLRLKPGQKLAGFSPNVPNSEFFQHVNLLLTIVGLNLGLPLVELLMDASTTNFSGIRGARAMAQLGFKRNQLWFRTKWHTPIYRWKLRGWLQGPVAEGGLGQVARDLLKTAVGTRKLFAHGWAMPRWEAIQPLDDAMASTLRVASLQSSLREEVQRATGRDIEDVGTETINDNAILIRKAILEAQKLTALLGGESVTWRDVLPRNMPTGVNLTAQTMDSLDVKNNSQAAGPGNSKGASGNGQATPLEKKGAAA